MGLLDQSNLFKPLEDNKQNTGINLSKEEIELLLGTLKNSHFKGEVVEILYNLVLKLQNSYLSYPNNKNDK